MLGPSIEVCAVQLPGRGSRFGDVPFRVFSALIEELAGVIRHRNQIPFAFFGHSLGALLAFELARYFSSDNIQGPAHLFISGCGAPKLRPPTVDIDKLSDSALIATLKDFNGTPDEILQNHDLMRLVLPTVRADFELLQSYRYSPGEFLNMPVTVLSGKSDHNLSEEEVLGWQNEASDPIQFCDFDGDHFFIDSSRALVLSCIKKSLDKWI